MPKKNSTAKKQNISPSLIAAIAAVVIAVVMIIVAAVNLIGGDESSYDAESKESVSFTASYTETSYEAKEEYSYVQIEMEDGGKIVLELYPEIAPVTVANFVKLASEGFYDGLTFHRVISGFMIQGGDPQGTGLGGSDEKIFGEFSANGFDNALSHTRGVISMARSSVSYDSASSQFFICHADSTYLDGDYAAFGRVVSGMDVVDAIAGVPTNDKDKPFETVRMKRVMVLQEAKASAESTEETSAE